MESFENIYTQYFSVVYKFSLSLCGSKSLAEEITQETFFKALKNIESFKGESKLSVWLCQIAKNTYYKFYQRNKKFSHIQEMEGEFDNFEQTFINQESAFEVHKALHNLNEPYKEVFSLRMFGELPFSQIGELFGKSESWARVTFHRAKIKIMEEIE